MRSKSFSFSRSIFQFNLNGEEEKERHYKKVNILRHSTVFTKLRSGLTDYQHHK